MYVGVFLYHLRAFMSLGEAFLHDSAFTTTMSISLELIIKNRPSVVKSIPTTAPEILKEDWSTVQEYQQHRSEEG